MKKTKIIFLIICLISCFTDCKKKDEPAPAPPATPAPAEPTVNNVPAGGDFYMTLNDGKMYWTQDLVTKHLYHSDYKFIDRIWHSGDTLLFVLNESGAKKLYYGSVHDPKNFKKINADLPASASDILYAGFINGVIVVYLPAVGGNLRGYCDVKNGETSLNLGAYSSVSDIHTAGYYHIGHALATVASIGFQNIFMYSRDGKNWFLKSSPTNYPSFIKKVGSTFYMATSGKLLYATTDSSFSSNSWANLVVGAPQLDTTGNSQGSYFHCNSTWYRYGYYQVNNSGINYPHYFSSTDATNWNGDYLNGDIKTTTYNGSGNSNIMTTFLTKNTSAISVYLAATNSYSVYTSANRTTFSLNATATAEGLNYMSFSQIYFE